MKDIDLVISYIQEMINTKLSSLLDDKFKVFYNERPCNIYIKNIAATIIKGHHLKRNIYLQNMSIGLSDLIWKVFGTIMNLPNEKNKKLNFLPIQYSLV